MERWTAVFGFCLLAILSSVAGAAEPEPNGDRASAPSITGGLPLSDFAASGVVVQDGTLGDADVDFFAFGVRAGEPVTLALFEPDRGELVDALLVVFDGAGARIAESDDDGPGFLSRLALLPAADDEWVVAVSRAGTVSTGLGGEVTVAPGFGTPFEYELVVSANGPAAVLDADVSPGPQGANDTPATAQPLAAPAAVVNGELVPDDIDLYALDTDPGDVVLVSIFEEDGGEFADSVVRLLRGGAEVAADDDGGTGYLSTLRHAVPPGGGGTLHLEVQHFARKTPVSAAQRFDYELVLAVASTVSRDRAFNCYAAKERPGSRFARRKVEILDAFGRSTAVAVVASQVCVAATIGSELGPDPNDQLLCYKLSSRNSVSRNTLASSDRFGTGDITLARSIEFCQPAVLEDDDLEALAERLNHYQCYRSRTAPDATPVEPGTQLMTDRFGTREVDLGSRSLHCSAVSEKNEESLPVIPEQELNCYDVKASRPRIAGRNLVEIRDQFGDLDMQLGRSNRVCVTTTPEQR